MSAARGRGDKKYADQLLQARSPELQSPQRHLAVVIFWDGPLLKFFGADHTLLPLARTYMISVKFTVPLFLFGQFLAAFLRNDNAPGKATAAVLSGGVFNIFGDLLFVFVLDMGIFGAGLATALGQALSIAILCTHFFSRKCTLRLARPGRQADSLVKIISTGFSTFFIDIAMGILSLMFNNQIMAYGGSTALAVYGVIININTLVQACSYGIGQAAQPLISVNFGAGKTERIRQTFFWSIATVAAMSILWTAVAMAFPLLLINLFMRPTKEVLSIAPAIMRSYFLSFLLLPLNIYSTYYFQAIMRPFASFLVSVLRGMVISGLLIYILPPLFGAGALWAAMPVTELLTAAGVILAMVRYNKRPDFV